MAYRVKQHELNLVLSFLNVSHGKGSRVKARVPDLKSAARHIGAFVTESVGMGMLTATMSDHYCWSGNHDNLEHFDALPADIAEKYQRRGVRPDLLFLDPAGGESKAGEARGRSTRPPSGARPTAAQRRQLNQMLGWSARHGYHPVTMAWTCLGGHVLTVDLFDVTFPPGDLRMPPPPSAPAPPPVPPAAKADIWPPPPTAEANDVSADEEAGLQGEQMYRRLADHPYQSIDGTDETGLAMGLSAHTRTVADYLYETAPENGFQVLNDVPVRGDWVQSDLVGTSRTHLFLGVLRREQPVDLQDMARRRRSKRGRSDDIQVDVFGRLIVAVALDSATAPPWEELSVRLE